MKKKGIILLGAGGHCKSCIEVIESTGEFEIEGILNRGKEIDNVLGYPVLGEDDQIDKYIRQGFHFLITVGQIADASIRIKLYNYLVERNALLPVIKASTAIISKHSVIGKGTIIMHSTVINSNSEIGANCIINTGTIIEHDVKIGNNCHISTKVAINGGALLGNEVFIGSGSTVFNNVSISDNISVGGGTTVVKALNDKGIYYENILIKKKGL